MNNLNKNLHQYFADFESKKEVKKAVKDVTPEPFFDRFKAAAKAAKISHYFLFSFFSIGAGWFWLWGIFSAIMPQTLAGILAALCLIFWEALKGFAIMQSFKSFYAYQKLSILFILLSAATLGGSCYVSITGAYEAGKYFSDKSQLILINTGAKVDSLAGAYNRKAADLQKKIDDLEALKISRGKKKNGSAWLTNVENEQQKTYLGQIAAIQKEREAALEETKINGQKAAGESAETGKKNAGALLIISGLNEALIFACVWFVWFFKHNVRNEQEALGEAIGAEQTDYLGLLKIAYQNMFTPPAIHIEMEGKQDAAPQISEMPQKPFLGFQYTGIDGTKGGAYMPTPDRFNADRFNADRFNADRLNADRLNADRLNADRLNVKYCQYEKCGKAFEYKSFAKKFCGDECRRLNWEHKTGATLKKPKPKK